MLAVVLQISQALKWQWLLFSLAAVEVMKISEFYLEILRPRFSFAFRNSGQSPSKPVALPGLIELIAMSSSSIVKCESNSELSFRDCSSLLRFVFIFLLKFTSDKIFVEFSTITDAILFGSALDLIFSLHLLQYQETVDNCWYRLRWPLY